MARAFTPGFRFKDGKLYAFTKESVVVLESWPKLEALRKRESEPWEKFDPVFRVVRPYRRRKRKESPQLALDLGDVPVTVRDGSIAEQRRRAFDGFRFSLPRPVAARAEKFQSRQWALLRLFHASEKTLELAALNPALCFALANHACFPGGPGSFAEATGISGSRQREIAGRLGFPSTDAAARVLAKIAPESASVELLVPLREALRDGRVMKALSHLPKLNAGVLAIALDQELLAACSPALLAEVAACKPENYRASTADLLGDTLDMIRTANPQRGTPQFQSLARLREVHDEVSVRFLQSGSPTTRTGRLPRPPLMGTAEIEPIRTLEDLVEEGRLQNNCVATYAERVVRSAVFIYRVLRPERATLSIVRGPDGDWQIGELERSSNRRVSPATLRFVESWLDQFALSA